MLKYILTKSQEILSRKVSNNNLEEKKAMSILEKMLKRKKEYPFLGMLLHEVPEGFCTTCKHHCLMYNDVCKGYKNRKRKRKTA